MGESALARIVRQGTSGAFAVEAATPAAATYHLRWGLGVPIRVHEQTTGALVFLRRGERPYDADEVAVAEQLGDRAGRALENARLHGEVGLLADRERRHAAELEAAIGALGEGILITNPDGSIRMANEAAVRLLGRTVATVEELLDHLLDPDDRRPSVARPRPRGVPAGRPAAGVDRGHRRTRSQRPPGSTRRRRSSCAATSPRSARARSCARRSWASCRTSCGPP